MAVFAPLSWACRQPTPEKATVLSTLTSRQTPKNARHTDYIIQAQPSPQSNSQLTRLVQAPVRYQTPHPSTYLPHYTYSTYIHRPFPDQPPIPPVDHIQHHHHGATPRHHCHPLNWPNGPRHRRTAAIQQLHHHHHPQRTQPRNTGPRRLARHPGTRYRRRTRCNCRLPPQHRAAARRRRNSRASDCCAAERMSSRTIRTPETLLVLSRSECRKHIYRARHSIAI